jgi:hypothetical protein
MKNLLFILLLISYSSLIGQTRIDGSFEFQNDSAKKYSLYIPSGYQAGTAHRLMLGLHPFNTNRWDAESWCDTLIVFAETNNLILACPDGGIDGAVDDPIDTAFTSILLDSIAVWYDVNPEKTYAMGFSVGGKTTYTYGLNHIDRFRGFMPIGAAVTISDVNNVIQHASENLYYLVHGANDSPNIRFTPLLNTLNDNGAITNSKLMPGVGHTIDFPNRNQILTNAFQWLDSVNCAQLTPVFELKENGLIDIFPNPVMKGNPINILADSNLSFRYNIEIFDQKGALVYNENNKALNPGTNILNIILDQGLYFIIIKEDSKVISSKKLMVY